MLKLASTGTISALGTETSTSVSSSGFTCSGSSPAATTSRTDCRSGQALSPDTVASSPRLGKPNRTPPIAGSER